MKKKLIIIILVCLVIIIIVATIYYIISNMRYTTIKMFENKEVLINPNRGVYSQIDTSQDYMIEGYYNGDEDTNFRLVLMSYDLNKYVNEEIIPDEKIQELKNALDTAREFGMAVIFRPGYFFSGDEEALEPEEFSTILKHEKQISEVINDYSDVIVCVQAGFIGPYGEWHSSDFMEQETDGMKNYILLLKNMLSDIDEKIAINVRRPMFIREAQSYGIDCSRVGFFDDGMFGSDTDLGTYVEEGYSREKELEWLSQNILTPYNGGEFPYVTDYSKSDNAIKELELMQVTYLNQYYNYEIWTDWNNSVYNGEKASDYIMNHLGYRLSIDEIEVPKKPDTTLISSISGKIRNTGFAKTNKYCEMYLAININDEIQYLLVSFKYVTEDLIEFSVEIDKEMFRQNNEIGEKIKLGIVMSDDKNIDEKQCIEFANDKVIYENGVNYFVTYLFNDKGWEISE